MNAPSHRSHSPTVQPARSSNSPPSTTGSMVSKASAATHKGIRVPCHAESPPASPKYLDLDVHPDFKRGDLIVACVANNVAFKVHGAMLKATVPALFESKAIAKHSSKVRDWAWDDATIKIVVQWVDDDAVDLAPFLAFIHAGQPLAHKYTPCLAHYRSLLHLIDKYGGRPYLYGVVHDDIHLRASDIAKCLTPHCPRCHPVHKKTELDLFLLACRTHNAHLWEAVVFRKDCSLNPWEFDPAIVKAAGETCYHALAFVVKKRALGHDVTGLEARFADDGKLHFIKKLRPDKRILV